MFAYINMHGEQAISLSLSHSFILHVRFHLMNTKTTIFRRERAWVLRIFDFTEYRFCMCREKWMVFERKNGQWIHLILLRMVYKLVIMILNFSIGYSFAYETNERTHLNEWRFCWHHFPKCNCYTLRETRTRRRACLFIDRCLFMFAVWILSR